MPIRNMGILESIFGTLRLNFGSLIVNFGHQEVVYRPVTGLFQIVFQTFGLWESLLDLFESIFGFGIPVWATESHLEGIFLRNNKKKNVN